MKLISNCKLCDKHSLHVFEENNLKLMQCINCGYSSTDKFLGTKDNCEEYFKLSDDMKNWAVEKDGRIWIPAMMTLPMGMLYPFNEKPDDVVDKVMRWAYAKMIDIPEEEREHYPIPNQEGMFYKKTYDVDNAKTYNTFFDAMLDVNKEIKNQISTPKLNLPKLKKIDG